MDLLINILGVAALGVMIQEFEPYQWLVKRLGLPDKPFLCTMCSTFWWSVGILISIYGIKGVAYAALAAISAEFIDRQLWKN